MTRVFKEKQEEYDRLSQTLEGKYIINSLSEMDQKSNLPLRAWGDLKLQVNPIDRQSFNVCNEYLKSVTDQVRAGRGLYIYGNAGNGKSSWVYKIAIRYMALLAYGLHTREVAVYFANVPELMNDLKQAFNDNALQRKLAYSIQNADLVIFDDIGAENATEWAKEQLYHFINYRYANGKATIFTSNLPVSSLEMRVADRIQGVCDIVEFKNTSRRATSEKAI